MGGAQQRRRIKRQQQRATDAMIKSCYVDNPVDANTGLTLFQTTLEHRAKHKPCNITTSKRFNRSDVDIDNDGCLIVRGDFVPTFGINTDVYMGHAQIEKYRDDSGTNVKPFGDAALNPNHKNNRLNESIKCRGQIAVSGGHVSNEMTCNVDAREIEIDTL